MQSRFTSVALANRIGGDKSECSRLPTESERAPKEVGNEVYRFTATFFMDDSQPVSVATSKCRPNSRTRQERRIPHKRIEPAILTRKNFGKLNLPVKRGNGMLRLGQASGGLGEALATRVIDLLL